MTKQRKEVSPLLVLLTLFIHKSLSLVCALFGRRSSLVLQTVINVNYKEGVQQFATLFNCIMILHTYLTAKSSVCW